MWKWSIINEEMTLSLIMICLHRPLAFSEHKYHTLHKKLTAKTSSNMLVLKCKVLVALGIVISDQ